MKRTLPVVFLLLFTALLYGQQQVETEIDQPHFDRCDSAESHDRMLEQFPEYRENQKNLEKQIQEMIERKEIIAGIITIPVVYHVIHNGDAVGSGENLSDALLQAQLDQMTADFRRTNSDAANTPALFTGVAVDTEIEFCLATIDPTGSPTTGINRVNISTLTGVSEADCWTQAYINSNIKIPTIWDRDKYMNFWTTFKINRTSDCAPTVLGYAQFPGGAANTDGIVCRSSTLGSIAMPNPGGGAFSLGRTATHEVGHFFNLIHIWGDGGCGFDDLVADTPLAGTDNNTGSPCTFPGPNSCDTGAGDQPDMFMNYMDYSDDVCMNMFSAGQKTRMIASINASRSALRDAPCGAGSACEDNLTISGALTEDHDANLTIVSSGATTIANSEDIELRAGEKVTLNYGFATSGSAGLYIGYGVCPAGPNPSPLNTEEENMELLRQKNIDENLNKVSSAITLSLEEQEIERYKSQRSSITRKTEMSAAELQALITRDRTINH